ncbi:MAG: transposase [Nanoarchaeota archaeon]
MLVFIDEAGFLMAPLVRRTWSRRGQTPVLRQRGRSRRKVSVIGAITISPRRHRVRGYFGFLPDANYDGEAILAFLKELSRRVRAPIEIVWDRLRAHHRGAVGAWLTCHRHRVRAHLLPAYAPELNPVELIWGYAKTNPMANFVPTELQELLLMTQRATLDVAENQPLLRSFIQHGSLPLCLR